MLDFYFYIVYYRGGGIGCNVLDDNNLVQGIEFYGVFKMMNFSV